MCHSVGITTQRNENLYGIIKLMNYIIYTALIFNSVNISCDVQEAKLPQSLIVLCISALDTQFYIIYAYVAYQM
jgi:3-methyladenine DNA glycosylase Mpg